MLKYTLESDVDDYVKRKLTELGLNKIKDFNEKSSMSSYLKEALKGAAKTNKKTNFGQPDFTIEKYSIPVVIEDKLRGDRLLAISRGLLKMDEKSVKDYAVNGAVYYAQKMIASKKYQEVIAIGISGESEEYIKIKVYYVFSPSIAPKAMENYQNLNFLENEDSFNAFYQDATITEEERHAILIKSRDEILREAKRLNKLMNDFNIGVEQRVVYVSGMLLSMQDVCDKDGNVLDYGLTIDDLKGISTEQNRDSVVIINHVQEFLDQKEIALDKKHIMIEQFKNSISLDASRDYTISIHELVGDILPQKASATKQIFAFLYKYVFLAIDMTQGALDIMAEMYSTFLKYALSDGASLGKVLTPPYVTNLMARILEINMESKVMDLATGSAAFLVAAMDLMVNDANEKLGKNTTTAIRKIIKVKKEQLLGIEVDAKMYTLAAANMILRGDGSSNIIKADSFTTPEKIFKQFAANKLLLNPPFSYKDFGLPFFEFGLDNMEKGGIGAVIVQDSAGSGKAVDTTKRILAKHTMLASIKMPTDLFIPNAIVQTSIYVFKAKEPHNFSLDVVRFFDFRNDGYKRTKRCIKDVDSPIERYTDMFLLYKLGKNAIRNTKFHSELWNIDKVYCEDTISENGDDWNFDKHIKHNTVPSSVDFSQTIKGQFAWSLQQHINAIQINVVNRIGRPYDFRMVLVKQIFEIKSVTPSFDKGDLKKIPNDSEVYDYITRTAENRGICDVTGFLGFDGLQKSGSFSLGLMQMVFFYRQRDWYAGQFVKVVSCKDIRADMDAKLYLETILNGLTNKLLSVLVRDVEETFLNSEILLPVLENGNVDYEWMSNYVKEERKQLVHSLVGEFAGMIDRRMMPNDIGITMAADPINF